MSEETQNAVVFAPVETSTMAAQNAAVANVDPVTIPETIPQPTEKVLTQSEVNEIVGRAKHETRERTRQEVLEEIQRQQADIRSTVPQQPQQQAQVPNMKLADMSAEDLNRIISQQMNDHLSQMQQQSIVREQEQHLARLHQEFLSKIQDAAKKYPDFQEKVLELQLGKVSPEVLKILASVENTGEVMYDIAHNPEKLSAIVTDVAVGLPHVAQSRISKLSNSIRMNQSAGQVKTAKEPLSQIQPSNNSIGDNGSPQNMSVSELKKQSWLRSGI